MVWVQVVKNFEYLFEEFGFYCGENGELLKVFEKRDDQVYSMILVRL